MLPYKKYLPWLVLILGLASTYFLKLRAMDAAQQESRAQFERQSDELVRQIEQRLESQMLILRGIAGFFAGNSNATKDEFGAYVEGLHIHKLVRGVVGVGFASAFSRENKARHIQEWRKTLGRNYTVWPSSQQALTTAIVFRTPFVAGTDNILGYDMYTDPVRRTAMELARNLQTSTITDRIKLKAYADQISKYGFLIYHPVYRHGSTNTTLAERRQNIAGWAYSPINIDEFLGHILETYGDGLQVAIHFAKEPSPASLITAPFDDIAHGESSSSSPEYRKLLEFGGQPWLIRIRATPSHNAKPNITQTVLIQIAGALISLLLFLYLRTLSVSRDRAEAIAAELTCDLRASEHRWHFAVEGQGDGLWDWNLQNNSIYFSPGWKKMLGYEEEDIGNHVEEWDSRVHPDDKQMVQDALQAFVLGQSSSYVSEHRLRCKDGSWKWILDRGMVVARATDGHALHIIGTHADITVRKAAEARAEQLSRLYATLSHVNHAIVQCSDEQQLFDAVCRIMVQYGGMKMGWIGMPDQQTENFRTVASAGIGATHSQGIRISTNPNEPAGNNLAAPSLHSNQPVWCQDVLTDANMVDWHHRATEEGWRSVATLPLYKMRMAAGVLAVYAAEANAFDENSRNLLLEISHNVSSALDHFVHEAERNRTEISLRESEARYSALFTDSSVVMLLIDPTDGRIVNANFQASIFYGWDIATLCSMNIRDINSMRPESITPEMIAALREEQKHFFFQHRCANGSLREVEVFSGPVKVGGETLVLSSIHDISQRKEAEEALERSEQQNTVILNSLMEHIALLDEHGAIVTVNDSWLRFAAENGASGSAAQWVGVNYLDTCSTVSQLPDMNNAIQAAAGIRKVLAEEISHFEMEYPCHSDSEERWFVMRVTRLHGMTHGVVVAHENITERKQAEIAIQASRLRLTELSAELIEAQENERKSLARELHDEMGQRLTMLNINLHQLRNLPPKQNSETLWSLINQEIAELINRIRSMSGAMRPPMLDHLGLEAAIRHLLQTHFANTQIVYELEYAGLPKKLAAQVEITVYRVIQEAITNIVRHAGATRVIVEINGGENAEELELVIRDNGTGFDTSKLDAPVRVSYGLTGMGERVKLLGGSLKVTSETGKGTRITALLPITT